MIRPGIAVCVLVCLAPAPFALATDIESRNEAIELATAGSLESLAEWCTKKRIFGKRDETYERLLELEPDHAKARKKLKFKRGEDGAWVQDPKYKRAKNWNRSAADAHTKRLASILDGHRSGVLSICAGARTLPDLLWARNRVTRMGRRHPGDKRVPRALRALTMRYHGATEAKGLVKEMSEAAAFLTSHYPGDAEVRTVLGEVEHEGGWILAETARTVGEASGLPRMLKEAVEGAAIEEAGLTAREKKIELPWTAGSAGADVRVQGTQKPEVLKSIAARVQAAGALFGGALGAEPSRRKGLAIYVFATKGELDPFLAGFPTVDNPTLKQRKKLDLVYADGYSMAVKANPPAAQTDLAVTEVVNQMFSDTFLKSAAPKGWHAEGISRYLAWKLTGTRLSISVSGRYAGQGGDRHVPESKDPWLKKVRGHLKKNPKIGLELLLGKGIDAFGVRDALLAYAFAIYLVEGYDGKAAAFVRAHEKTTDVDRACREVLGRPRAVVEHRLTRWLDEVIAAQKGVR